MMQAVQFPLRTEPKNVKLARTNRFAQAHQTKEERGATRLVLDSQLAHVRLVLPPVGPGGARRLNTFRVTLTRISSGWLDDDGIGIALAGVRDEVAAWIGLDDGRKDVHRLRFKNLQQRCPFWYAGVRILVEDDDDEALDRVLRVVGRTPDRLGAADERAPTPIPKKRSDAQARRDEAARLQQRLPLARTAWAQCPWDEEGVLTRLPDLDYYKPTWRIPLAKSVQRGRWAGPTSTEVTLYLREDYDEELGAIWLYSIEKPKHEDENR